MSAGVEVPILSNFSRKRGINKTTMNLLLGFLAVVLGFLLGAGIVFGIIAIISTFIWLGWVYFAVPVFGVTAVSWLQMFFGTVGLAALIGILRGLFRGNQASS